MEIVTDDDAGCAELLPEQALDESGGRRCRQAPASKRRTKAPSSPSLRKTASFAGSGVRRNRGFSGAKNLRGCGSKVRTAAGAPPRPGLPDRDLDQRLMAAMDAVEIADRQDRAAQGRRHGVAVAADGESARGLFGRRS